MAQVDIICYNFGLLKINVFVIIMYWFFRYTKPKGQLPDYQRPVVLQTGRSTVEDLCNQLHKTIMKEFKQWVKSHAHTHCTHSL